MTCERCGLASPPSAHWCWHCLHDLAPPRRFTLPTVKEMTAAEYAAYRERIHDGLLGYG